jgi:hypothetical protein
MQATTIDPVAGELEACEFIAQNSLERAKQKTPDSAVRHLSKAT